MRIIITIIILLFACNVYADLPCTEGNTDCWVVRYADGGTCGSGNECNGHYNAAYPGTGTDQNCACNNIQWVTGSSGGGSALWSGGDALYVHDDGWVGCVPASLDDEGDDDCRDNTYNILTSQASCYLTYDYGGCNTSNIPSGDDTDNKTKIYGNGWDSGCTDAPRINGWAGAVFSLDDSNYVDIRCLEITDNSLCDNTGGNGTACSEDYASRGIYMEDSVDIYMKDINIHGIGGTCITMGRIEDLTMEDSRLSGCGLMIINGDIRAESHTPYRCGSETDYEDEETCTGAGFYWWNLGGEGSACHTLSAHDCTANDGDLVFNNTEFSYGGCVEDPDSSDALSYCVNQGTGGYGNGDAFGLSTTNGDWVFSGCTVSYNGQDGLDFLHAIEDDRAVSGSIYIDQSYFFANVGQSIKSTMPVEVNNSVIIGNCNYMAEVNPDLPNSGYDQCRAYDTLAFGIDAANSVKIYNSTIYSEGSTIITVVDYDLNDPTTCDGSEVVEVRNSIIYGDNYLGGDLSGLYYLQGCAGYPPELTMYNTNTYHIKNGTCPGGSEQDNICEDDPEFTTISPPGEESDFVLTLTATSPGLDAADETITCAGDCTYDYTNSFRGSAWDIGAYEYDSEVTPGSGNRTFSGGCVYKGGIILK